MQKNLIFLLAFWAISLNNSVAQCWNLVWADEFSGTSLDLNKWSYQTGAGGWGNNELQNYTNRVDNATVGNGTLKIIAKTEVYGGANYTSARIRTINKGDWRYGRIEMRAKLPIGQGIWPAFWMMPTENVYGTWPNSGEIDIMENLGHQPSITYGTIHTQSGVAGVSAYSTSSYTLPAASGTFASSFNVFAIEWEPNEIRWYVNNVLFATKTPTTLSPWRFSELFHIILNVAVGGNWPGAPNGSTIFPQQMEIDYVRVYQKNSDLMLVGASRIEPSAVHTFSVPTITGSTYLWSVDNGTTILSGQGTANIQIKAGFANTNLSCAITTNCGATVLSKTVTVDANMLPNPSFESDFLNWSQNKHNNANATFFIDNIAPPHLTKTACVTTNAVASNTWDIQLGQSNINLLAGQSYTLKFWAKANAPRTIAAAIINSTTYAQVFYNNVNLTTTWNEFSYTFTPTVNVNTLLNFDCGGAIGTYCFDNVVLAKSNQIAGANENYVNAKIFLSSIDNATNLMPSYLKTLANFPLTDPYKAAPFNSVFLHVNNSATATTTPSVLNVTGANAIVDWVFLSLETDDGVGTTVVATKTALLQSDGDIVGTDGVSAVRFDNAVAGNYYVKISHRNHLSFRTLNKVTLGVNTLNLDLTSNSTTSYGPMRSLTSSKKGMVGGDANFDGSIDAFDTIKWEQQNGLFDDYSISSDYNLDGSSDAFDTIIWELGNGLFYP